MVQAIQSRAVSGLLVLGDFTLFMVDSILAFRRIFRRRGLFFKQCENIGVTSIGIIAIAALFMGGVLGYQLYVSFHYFGAESLLGGSVGVSLFRELAPVMAAIMVIGRSGAAMAAEIASMRISEQVDALEVMAVDPFEYLVLPRILAGTLMMPIIAMFFAVVGTIAAAGVACGIMGLQWVVFWKWFTWMVDKTDMLHCVVKGGFFGLFLTWIGCFNGFRARGGASSVGYATKNTVVASCLTILLVDFILTSFLPFGFPILTLN